MPAIYVTQHWFLRLLLICVLCTLAGQCPIIGLTGQTLDVQIPPNLPPLNIIRVNTNLVTIPVSVADSKGHPVDDLRTDDFLVEEDGRKENVSRLAGAGQSPLQLTLLLDLSGSVHPRFHFERQAAMRFLSAIWKSGDSISIITFSEQPMINLAVSSSLEDALQILWSLQPTEAPTRFFDSVILSAKMMRRIATPEVMQSVVALSDGEDNHSEQDLSIALREVQNSAAIFYSINPAGSSIRLNEISRKGQADLESLAKETGGRAFVLNQSDDLEDIFRRIAIDLRAQYLLSYYSTNSQVDGNFRQILVSIPRRPGLHVRARRGYYASKQ